MSVRFLQLCQYGHCHRIERVWSHEVSVIKKENKKEQDKENSMPRVPLILILFLFFFFLLAARSKVKGWGQ